MIRPVRKLLLIIIGLIIICDCSFAQITLKVEIIDLRNNTGKIMLQVFNEKEKVMSQETGDIMGKSCFFTIKNINAGKYAVRFYHDENLNQIMETNAVGKPTEGYGFSNNVKERFSMPPFEKWLFSLKKDTTIVLKAVY